MSFLPKRILKLAFLDPSRTQVRAQVRNSQLGLLMNFEFLKKGRTNDSICNGYQVVRPSILSALRYFL